MNVESRGCEILVVKVVGVCVGVGVKVFSIGVLVGVGPETMDGLLDDVEQRTLEHVEKVEHSDKGGWTVEYSSSEVERAGQVSNGLIIPR